MKPHTWHRKILPAAAVIILGIQFIPISRNNPPVVKELDWDSAGTRKFAQRACFDCHSNQVRWPWYSRVAPVSWLISSDVGNAREMLNFSAITDEDGFNFVAKQINKGVMPPKRYLALHAEARLTDAEKTEFLSGLKKSFELSGL
ncbi:MAG: heme-binding domain-containing protein [Luteolibacter sp.]